MRHEEKFICARRANRPGSQRLVLSTADYSPVAFILISAVGMAVTAADGDRPRAGCFYGCTCTRKNCARVAFVPVKVIVAPFVACRHGVTGSHAARFVEAFTW